MSEYLFSVRRDVGMLIYCMDVIDMVLWTKLTCAHGKVRIIFCNVTNCDKFDIKVVFSL